MSSDRAPGPENSQAAVSMGNSVSAWKLFYDKQISSKQSQQQGIQLMGDWRRQMLVQETADVQIPDAVVSLSDDSASENASDVE